MSNLTGLILASGQGSRFAEVSREHEGKPKHVFEFPNGQTPVGRIAASLISSGCDRIICTVGKAEQIKWFEAAFKGIKPEVEIVVKENPGTYTEFAQVAPMITSANTIQTNGDLVFPKGMLEAFIAENGASNFFILGKEGSRINSRASIVPTRILHSFTPTDLISRARIILEVGNAVIRGRVVKLSTLFNIDTRSSYEAACEFFKLHPEA